MTSPVPAIEKFSPNDPHVKFEWAMLHIGFVAVGLITPLLGPLIPTLKSHWAISDAQAGTLFAAQFTGSFIGTVLTSYLLPRLGFSKMLALGFFWFALGFSFFGLGPWTLGALAVAAYGFGYGLANPATNLRATQLPSRNVAAAVSLLNFSWGLGAVICPFLAGFLVPLAGLRGLALFLMTFTAAIAAVHYFKHLPETYSSVASASHSLADWKFQMSLPAAVPLALLFFLYVGVEVSVGGWVASQEKRLPGAGTATLTLAPSFFYGMLLLGRGLSPLLFKKFSTPRLSIIGLIAAAVGTAIILLSPNAYILYAGSAIAGFGLASQFPIFVTWLAQIFKDDATWLSALFFGVSALGGAVLPWLLGQISSRTGSLRIAFLVPLLGCVVMALLSREARPLPDRP